MQFSEFSSGFSLNLICNLLSFQVVFRVNINLTKFELVKVGDGRDAPRLVRVSGCKNVKLRIKYFVLLFREKYKDVRM